MASSPITLCLCSSQWMRSSAGDMTLSQRSLNPDEDETGQVKRNSVTTFLYDISNTMTATALLFSKMMLSIGFEGEKRFLHVYIRTGTFWPSVCNTARQLDEILESHSGTRSCKQECTCRTGNTTADLQKTHVLPTQLLTGWISQQPEMAVGFCRTVLYSLCSQRQRTATSALLIMFTSPQCA